LQQKYANKIPLWQIVAATVTKTAYPEDLAIIAGLHDK